METKTLGQIAFEAFVVAVGGKTYDGKPIPTWENLTNGQDARDAWEAAAKAVKQKILFLPKEKE